MEDSQTPTYSESDAAEMAIHCAKANLVCGQVRKLFNICRASPFGRVIDPSVCSRHAKDLLQCFHDVRLHLRECYPEYQEVSKCAERRKDKEGFFAVAMCEGPMNNYMNCAEPETAHWAEYS
jgi:hypothetical protein